MSYKLKYNPSNNKISFNTKIKNSVSRHVPRKVQQDRQPKRPGKNTLEQRVRKLENENKLLWEALGKLENAMGIKRSKEIK